MAIVDTVPLLQHVLGLGRRRVRGTVLVDVAADVGEEVCAVTGGGEGGAEPGEVALVGGKLVAEKGEVVLFQGGGGEGCFGVEEAGELGDDGFSLMYRGG